MFERFSYERYENPDLDGYALNYRLFIPEDYDEKKSYPVMFFLHGAGERGEDNEKQLNLGIPKLFEHFPEYMNETIIVAPQCPDNERWVDTDWGKGNYAVENCAETKQIKTALAILKDTFDRYRCDRSRVYVCGISMGGFGTWDVLARHGGIFAAGVPICGGGDPSKADLLKEIPIFTFHGDLDKTVPFAGTEQMYNSIKSAGGEKIRFKPIIGGWHSIWDAATSDREMIEWLYAQCK